MWGDVGEMWSEVPGVKWGGRWGERQGSKLLGNRPTWLVSTWLILNDEWLSQYRYTSTFGGKNIGLGFGLL